MVGDNDIFSLVRNAHKEEDRRNEVAIRNIVITISAIFALSLAVSWLVISYFPEYSCSVATSSSLKTIWPANAPLSERLTELNAPHQKVCDLVSARSIMSAFLATYVVALGIRSLFSKKAINFPGSMLPLVVLALASLATSFLPISSDVSLFRMSIYSSTTANILNSSVNIFCFYFFAAFVMLRAREALRSRDSSSRN